MKLIFEGTNQEIKAFKAMLRESNNCPVPVSIKETRKCDCVCINDEECPYIEVRHQHWRAELNKIYYFIRLSSMAGLSVSSFTERGSGLDNILFNQGNYFQTKG